MIKKRLKILKKKISNLNIDGYIIPKNDEFFSEYAFTDRLKIISDFTGSAGVAIILINKNYLFVDGRYTVQAEQQSGQNFSIVETHKFLPKEILKNLTLGIDPGVFTEKQLKPFVNKSIKIKLIKNNLVDEIYSHKRTTRKNHRNKRWFTFVR